jgi:hypothetical protein
MPVQQMGIGVCFLRCSNTTNIVPRLAEANARIPAYLDSRLAWGSQPIAVRPS